MYLYYYLPTYCFEEEVLSNCYNAATFSITQILFLHSMGATQKLGYFLITYNNFVKLNEFCYGMTTHHLTFHLSSQISKLKKWASLQTRMFALTSRSTLDVSRQFFVRASSPNNKIFHRHSLYTVMSRFDSHYICTVMRH